MKLHTQTCGYRLQRLQEQLARQQERGDVAGQIETLNAQGALLAMLGQYEQARQRCQQALRLSQEQGDRRGEAASLGNLGVILREQGDPRQALALHQKALTLAREGGDRQQEAVAQVQIGLDHLALGALSEARHWLLEGYEASRKLGLVEPAIRACEGMGLAWLQTGKLQPAKVWAGRAVEMLGVPQGEVRPTTLVERPRASSLEEVHHAPHAYYVYYRVLRAAGQTAEASIYLAMAHRSLMERAQWLQDPAWRETFLRRVPSHRAVLEAWEACEQRERGLLPGQQRVRLARSDAPLGRPLTERETVSVIWTIDAPDDRRFRNKAERRRYRLLRLLQEAADQGAAPTDEDLAAALDVSRRTILRDIAALEAAGFRIPTRRRGHFRSASPSARDAGQPSSG